MVPTTKYLKSYKNTHVLKISIDWSHTRLLYLMKSFWNHVEIWKIFFTLVDVLPAAEASSEVHICFSFDELSSEKLNQLVTTWNSIFLKFLNIICTSNYLLIETATYFQARNFNVLITVSFLSRKLQPKLNCLGTTLHFFYHFRS